MKNAKRILSLILCVLMTLSMVTAIVLPAAAESSEGGVSEAIADPYGIITKNESTGEPADNVVFVDTTWLDQNNGYEFDYTYAGNNTSYHLTWGKNAAGAYRDIKTLIQDYANSWVEDPTGTVSRDFVVVLAAGAIGDLGLEITLPTKAAEGAVPTPEQMLNIHLLGAKAGVNPVNDARANATDVKTVQNGRSTSDQTESVFLQKLIFPANCNITIDGFSARLNASFVVKGENQYVNVKLRNLFVDTLVYQGDPYLYQAYEQTNASTWEFTNCFFNFDDETTTSNATSKETLRQDIYSTKVLFNNCAFIGGEPAKNASGEKYDGTFVTRFLAPGKTDATAAANFYGEYAAKPEFTVQNCVSADWESSHLFIARVGSYNVNTYEIQKAVQYNFLNNKFYDFMGSAAANASVIKLQNYSNITRIPQINIVGNVFTASASLDAGDRKLSFIECGAGAAPDAETGAITGNTPDGEPTRIGDNSARGETGSGRGVEMKIIDNVFSYPNQKFGDNNYFYPVRSAVADDVSAVDLSSNLYVNTAGKVLPNIQERPRAKGFAVQSDIYVSGADAQGKLTGGVRETMTIEGVKGGALLYNYIMLTASTAWSGGKSAENAGEHQAYEVSYNKNYFMGAATILLERGKTYNTSDLFTFTDDNTVFKGVFTDEACTQSVATLTQDQLIASMGDNAVTKYYLKASYTANGTTATVVYALKTPTIYYIIAPNGSTYWEKKSYTFNGVTYEGGSYVPNKNANQTYTVASDGVKVIFENQLLSEIVDDHIEFCHEQKYLSKIAYDYNQTAPVKNYEAYADALYGKGIENFGPHTLGLEAMVLFTPGTHTYKFISIRGSMAFVGPQFTKSPYDAELNRAGQLANGRKNVNDADATEAIVPIGFRTLNNLNANFFSFNGIVFNSTKDHSDDGKSLGEYGAIHVNSAGRTEHRQYLAYLDADDQVVPKNQAAKNPDGTLKTKFFSKIPEGDSIKDESNNTRYHEVYRDYSWKRDSDYTGINIKNCIFNTSQKIAASIAPKNEDDRFDEAQLLDFQMHDSIYYSVGTEIKTPDTFFEIEATRKVVENFSIVTEYCHTSEIHKKPFRYEGNACDWKTTYLDFEVADDIPTYYAEHGKLVEEELLEPTYTEPGHAKFHCDVCKASGLEESIVVATISGKGIDGETIYYDMEEAFLAVQPNQTLTLQYTLDRTNPAGIAEYTIIDKNVTVNLNGHELGTGYAVGFKGSALIDTSKAEGKLIVPKEKVLLDSDNQAYLPTYETVRAVGDTVESVEPGYIFTNVNMARIAWNKYSDNVSGKYQFCPRFNPVVHEPLKLGHNVSANEVVLRLTWTETETDGTGYVAYQDFVYDDAYVKTIMDHFNTKYQNDYRYTFWATLSRTDVEAKGITMYAIVRSDTGVDIVSAPLTFNINSPVTPVE